VEAWRRTCAEHKHACSQAQAKVAAAEDAADKAEHNRCTDTPNVSPNVYCMMTQANPELPPTRQADHQQQIGHLELHTTQSSLIRQRQTADESVFSKR